LFFGMQILVLIIPFTGPFSDFQQKGMGHA